ncbi:hypothetical protein JCM15765_02710 [Paradesulfitobacterium aromaticivorans]
MQPEDLLELKSFEQVRDEAVADLQTRKFRITNFRPGRIFYTLLELAAKAASGIYTLLPLVLRQLFLSTATGAWLDLVAADRAGVYRKQAQKAKWNLRVGRQDTSQRATVPLGSIATTQEDASGKVLRYFATSKVVLDVGVAEALVPFEAEFGGAGYNVGPGQINRLGLFLVGIDSITNDADGLALEGTDTESDDSLRLRALNKTVGIAYGGSKEMYRAMAEEIVGVARARVDTSQPRGEGTIDVVLLGTEGVPSQTVIDQVVAKYDKDGSAIADIAVYPCELLNVPVTVILYKDPKQGSSDAMKLQAESLITEMFKVEVSQETPHFDPDYGVDRSLISSLRWFIRNTVSIDIIEPAIDAKVGFKQLAVPGVITVTVQEG